MNALNLGLCMARLSSENLMSSSRYVRNLLVPYFSKPLFLVSLKYNNLLLGNFKNIDEILYSL